jgi:hypothetical protein
LLICDFRINQKKFADFKFADLHTSENFGISIADRAQFADLRIADFKKTFTRPPLVLAKHNTKRYAITAYNGEGFRGLFSGFSKSQMSPTDRKKDLDLVHLACTYESAASDIFLFRG